MVWASIKIPVIVVVGKEGDVMEHGIPPDDERTGTPACFLNSLHLPSIQKPGRESNWNETNLKHSFN